MANATNIVGNNHKAYVNKQIKVRQEVLGNKLRSEQELSWINSKTGWIRAISSVDITDGRIPKDILTTNELISDEGKNYRLKILGIESYPGGNALAKDFTLFAGSSPTFVPSNQAQSFLRFGLSEIDSINPGIKQAYGLGGTEFGLKAMPGITGFTTSNQNVGALRISTLSFKANNPKQFEYLETLYMRLGYTILVEWGNSSYYTGNGSTKKYISGADANPSLAPEFLKAQINNLDKSNAFITEFYKKIEELREKTEGNYDAILAKVRNFSWSLSTDGSYDVRVELVSYGDVVESLSITNLLLDTNIKDINFPVNSSLEAFTILASKFERTITKTTPSNTANTGDRSADAGAAIAAWLFKDTYDSELYEINEPNQSVKDWVSTTISPTGSNEVIQELNYDRSITPSSGSVIAGTADFSAFNNGSAAKKEKIYIRFGDILDFINQKCLIYDEKNRNLIKIDTNPDTNLGFSNAMSVSANPNKVMVRSAFNLNLPNNNELKVRIFKNTKQQNLERFHFTNSNVNYCKIMNLYFEYEFIKDILKKELDTEEDGLNLYDFLKTLLEAANKSLGSVNQFNIRLSDDNTLQIYDEVRPVGYENLLEQTTPQSIFNIYGLSNSQGSFVRNYGINSQLSKNFSTLISVGAQSQGIAVGEDATFFSKWNKGLRDRIVPTKVDINALRKAEAKNYTKEGNLVQNYINFLRSYTQALRGPSGKSVKFLSLSIDPETTAQNIKTQKDFFRYFTALLAQQADTLSPSIGFIPINLQLTIDGISGIRIFDSLSIDTEFLPSNYGSNLDFIIKTVTHEINNANQWVTNLETFATPKSKGYKPANVQNWFIKAVEQLVAPTAITTSTTTSRFDLLKVFDPSKGGRGQRVTKRNVSIEDILKLMNQDSNIQRKFRGFFNQLIQDERFKNGYIFQINDVGRELSSNTGVGLNSAHVYYGSIDIQINDIETGKTILSNNGPTGVNGGMRNAEGQKAWLDFGIPQIAYEHDLEWGGLWTTGNWKYDNVHFTAIRDWSKYSDGVVRNLLQDAPLLKSLGSYDSNNKFRFKAQSNLNQMQKAALQNIILQNYISIDDNGVVTTNKDRLIYKNNWKEIYKKTSI